MLTIRSLVRMMLLIYGVVVVLSFLTAPTTAGFQSTSTVETTIRIDMDTDVEQASTSQANNVEPLANDVEDSSEVNGNEGVEELGEKE